MLHWWHFAAPPVVRFDRAGRSAGLAFWLFGCAFRAFVFDLAILTKERKKFSIHEPRAGLALWLFFFGASLARISASGFCFKKYLGVRTWGVVLKNKSYQVIL